jgi:hypothetical protein
MYIVYIWKLYSYQIRQFTIINSNSISGSIFYNTAILKIFGSHTTKTKKGNPTFHE